MRAPGAADPALACLDAGGKPQGGAAGSGRVKHWDIIYYCCSGQGGSGCLTALLPTPAPWRTPTNLGLLQTDCSSSTCSLLTLILPPIRQL